MKKFYRLYSINYFEEVDVEIPLGLIEATRKEAVEIANSIYNVRLLPDHLQFQVKGEGPYLTRKKSGLLFKLCTKQFPEPIDVSTYSHDQIMALFYDSDRIATPEDYKEMAWGVEEAYRYLMERYTPKNEANDFAFDSLAYRVDEVKGAYRIGTCEVCEKEHVPLQKGRDGFDVYILDLCAPSCKST